MMFVEIPLERRLDGQSGRSKCMLSEIPTETTGNVNDANTNGQLFPHLNMKDDFF